MCDDQLVIPNGFRDRVLDVLHAALQTPSFMLHRAAQSALWPGYTADIGSRRASCHDCNTTDPSQQQVPVKQSDPLATPFVSIAWWDITQTAQGPAGSRAKGLVACLRLLFADKEVPDILYPNGGTELTSAETQTFLEKWQIKNRLSSTHSP